MRGTIDVIIMRHEERALVPESLDLYPGCLQDIEIPLTPRGVERSEAFGRELLAQKHYDVIHAASSHQRAAMQTLAHALKGAGFRITAEGIPRQPGITVTSSKDISCRGWDWKYPGLPDFNRTPNDYIYKLLTEFFFPRSDIESEHPAAWLPPVMARLAFDLVHEVNAGIANIARSLQHKAQYNNGLVLVVTHAGYIDALANVLVARNVFPDSHHVPQGVTLYRYLGYYGTGEYISGRLSPISESVYGGPFAVKDVEVPVSDLALKSLKRTLMECADGDLSRVIWPIELPQMPSLPDNRPTRLAPVVHIGGYLPRSDPLPR